MVSVAAAQLCSAKAAIDDVETDQCAADRDRPPLTV